jgi:hypothetical protein
MTFWPKKLNFQNILINSLGSLIAGIIGSILILVITFFISNIISIPGTFEQARTGIQTSSIFPILLSIITLIWTTTTIILTYIIAHLTDSERYKKNIIILWQISFFAFLTYLFITPIYIYAGIQDYDNIMIAFLFHTIIVIFGTSIILEILNNYRYILTGVYGSFVGLFISIILTILIFSSFSSGFAKLLSLVLLLPIINFSTTFFKQIFEYLYFHYHKYSNQDQLWDIFYQIEMEEKELLREEEEKNSI